jgi:4-hydroxyphenylpyruvate dioxygenase
LLTAEQYAAVEELGILVDKDDQGVLMQIFTKPLGDRCARTASGRQSRGRLCAHCGVGARAGRAGAIPAVVDH